MGSLGGGAVSVGEGGDSTGGLSSGSCTHISQRSLFAGKAKASAPREPSPASIRDAGATIGGLGSQGTSVRGDGQESRIPHSSQAGIREIISSREGSKLKSVTGRGGRGASTPVSCLMSNVYIDWGSSPAGPG